MQRFEKWTKSYLQHLKADKDHELQPQELENHALAAYMTGNDPESFQILERAHLGYLEQNKKEQAARCAFWLGLILMGAGESTRGSGWMAKGERLLGVKQEPDCSEKGLFFIPKALGALYSGNSEKAQELFEHAIEIGNLFDDIDLIALGRLGRGQALVQKGDVSEGLKLLDEMMILVEIESVFPIATGIIYCAAIETCRKVWDLKRAQEWTSALNRWCNSQPDIIPFRGQCLIHRAEIIQFHGEWYKALEETKTACELLTRPPGEPAAGEAFYRQGELNRLIGHFKEAENCYFEAAKRNRTPQPGLALLRLAQGQNNIAATSIRNTLNETKDTQKRSELLSAVVRIMLSVNQTDEAIEATEELCSIANEFDAPYLYAESSYCLGAISFANGNTQNALEHLQKALKLWNAMHLPYESALTRELKALVYHQLNDKDNARIHLSVAKWIFEQLKAQPDLDRINRVLIGKQHYKTHDLTLREVQVLQRLASGKTNKNIATELFISERTVDRHVSNIFNKFGVSSRVEATTFALKNKILDQALL